jgi:hypothetical protein
MVKANCNRASRTGSKSIAKLRHLRSVQYSAEWSIPGKPIAFRRCAKSKRPNGFSRYPHDPRVVPCRAWIMHVRLAVAAGNGAHGIETGVGYGEVGKAARRGQRET